MIEKPNTLILPISTKNPRLLMMISLQVLSCNSGSRSLHVAVKKEGYNVGNTNIVGFGKGRVSGDLEFLVITPHERDGHQQWKICIEHQQGQKGLIWVLKSIQQKFTNNIRSNRPLWNK
jgi:hypothetical protein